MEQNLPACPSCDSEYAYESGNMLVCPMCGHEWNPAETAPAEEQETEVTKDSVGNELRDGDDVTIVKSLKVKGGDSLKIGTKVRNIRILDVPVNGHDIDARIPGVGQMYLKSSVVRKS
ncbi:zinc ribbon domain-containing protein YjdM [Micrococcoides hystricis]|uniref:Zinc ribbon domain-containing protein YjdM n=1 Tax=Micrococcoides hystricis TaxID=1572761 RepID=A0ABV6P8H6_9MICC